MRALVVASILVAGCHGGPLGKVRALGHRVAGEGCENRIVHGMPEPERFAVFGYDGDGHLISYRETNVDDEVIFAMTRRYDARGRRVAQVEDVSDMGPAHRDVTWAYDDLDRVTEVVTDFDGEVRRTQYVYRDDGLIDRKIETGASDEIVRYTYSGSDPLVIDELHDGWGWRYTFARGRWLVRHENLDADGNASRPTVYTYADLERGRLARRDFDLDAEGVPFEVNRFTWTDDRVTRATYGTHVVDYEYDDDGRVVRRRWSSAAEKFAYVTTYAWSGDDVTRVERRDEPTGELIEVWSIEHGCWGGDHELTIPLAPISSWDDELDPVGFGVDLRTFWGVHDVL